VRAPCIDYSVRSQRIQRCQDSQLKSDRKPCAVPQDYWVCGEIVAEGEIKHRFSDTTLADNQIAIKTKPGVTPATEHYGVM
jgi:hypothetical protein